MALTEAMKTFQRLQKDLGMGVALESFQKVLAAVEAHIYHDAVGVTNTIAYLKNITHLPRNS